MMVFRKDPVILLGMHRSGTTLLAEILKSLGVFLGETKGPHLESPRFRKLNRWILDRVGHGRWDRPVDLVSLLNERPGLKEAVIKELREKADNPKFFSPKTGRISIKNFFKRETPVLWAWKDPRTMLVWPLWSSIYPEAKFIFIHRNGIDAASSLAVREEKRIESIHCGRTTVNTSKYLSLRCMDIARAFGLWEEYHDICFRHYENAGTEFLTVCYEALLKNPANEIGRICDYLEVQPDRDALESICSGIDPERAFSFLKDRNLCTLYDSVKTAFWMKKFGYDTITRNA